MVLRKKLRNSTILMRMAEPWGIITIGWLLVGETVLYISMMNAAIMAESKVFCMAIVRDSDVNSISDVGRLSPG